MHKAQPNDECSNFHCLEARIDVSIKNRPNLEKVLAPGTPVTIECQVKTKHVSWIVLTVF